MGLGCGRGFDPEFTWHDIARIWQAPGEGEEFFAGIRALPLEQRADTFAALGIPHDHALDLARSQDEVMHDCILELYRSAVGVEQKWGPTLDGFRRPVWC